MKTLLIFLLTSCCILQLSAQKDKTYTSLEEALKNPDLVYKLNLRGKRLESLPKEIGKLTNLKYLYLDGNQLNDTEKEKIKAALPNTKINF